MKHKRTLLVFIAFIVSVCVPCAFLAGCADNETNKDEVADVDNNVSDTGFDYSLVTGDEVFNEGVTLDELKEYFADVTSVSIYMTRKGMDVSDDLYSYMVIKDDEYSIYEAVKGPEGEEVAEKTNWTLTGASFILNEYRYDCNYGIVQDKDPLQKSFAIYTSDILVNIENILTFISDALLMQGSSRLEFNNTDYWYWVHNANYIDEYLNQDKYKISTYLNLKGSLLECGYIVEGKPGSESEGYKEQYDYKVYGINMTEIEIPDVDLSTATWSDTVEYNEIQYRKATDSDGSEYYYVYYNPSFAEPETTINTLPVKPREN